MDLYYVTTPIYVINSNLGDSEKIVLGILMSLSTKEGYCYATNDYLALKTNKNEDAVKKIISRLKQYGIIRVEEVSRKNRERKIYINDLQKLFTYSRKTYSNIPSSETSNAADENVSDPQPSQQPKPKRTTTQININNVGSVTLTDKMQQYATEKGYTQEQTTQIFEHFLSHHTSKGSTFRNWDAAFNTWLFNSQRFDAQKKFSNGAPRPSSEKNSVGQRLMAENILLEDHAIIEEQMQRRMIFIADVLCGSTTLSEEFSDIGIMTLSTTKTGVKKIWYRKSKWAQNSHDDSSVVELLQ